MNATVSAAPSSFHSVARRMCELSEYRRKEMVQIWCECFGTTEDEFPASQLEKRLVFVAESAENELLAFVFLQTTAEDIGSISLPCLTDACTNPKHQRRGIMQALLKTAMLQCAEFCPGGKLHVQIDYKNLKPRARHLVKLYQSVGFCLRIDTASRDLITLQSVLPLFQGSTSDKVADILR